MNTHNIGFYEDLIKIIFELSSNMHLISSAEAALRSTLASATSFLGNFSPSPADSRRASYQLLTKEWAKNTGKQPLEGLYGNFVVW